MKAARPPERLVLLGHPVAHSLSPHFQGAALAAAGLAVPYDALDVPPEAWDATLDGLRNARVAGNVTVPYKARMCAACGRLTDAAQRAGAVNTFWTERGEFVGDNTDVAGFRHAAEALLDDGLGGVRVTLIGAGGAAAAVCAAVEAAGGRVQVFSRSEARSRALEARFPATVAAMSSLDTALVDATLVVNATPLGLHAQDPVAVPIPSIPRDAAVLDLVYRRVGTTPWIATAQAEGRRAADGRQMLLEQGAAAFERWFGFAPDRQAMSAALGRAAR